MEKITITQDQGVLSLNSDEPLALDTLFTILLNAIKGTAQQFINDAPAPDEARGIMFDYLNLAFSRTLEDIDPSLSPQTTLTAKAIREAEDRIIMEGRLEDVEPGS